MPILDMSIYSAQYQH